jgi:polysaccharide biosynthesis protein PelF
VPGIQVRIWGETIDSNRGYEAECRAECERLGLGDVVTFEGRTDDVTGALGSVDVLAMSSVSEGLPYSVLEAMMSGVPVVSTDVGGIAEALKGVGELIPPGDPEALAAACSHLLTSDARRRSAAKRARRRAMKDFTMTKMIDAYRNAYDDLRTVIDLRPAPEAADSRELVAVTS